MLPDITRLLVDSDTKLLNADTQATIDLAKKAFETAIQSGLPEQITSARIGYAQVLVRLGYYKEAREVVQDMLASLPATPETVEAQIIAGICAAEIDDIDEAQKWYYDAADLSRKIHYTSGLANALNQLSSSVFLPRGQFNLALAAIDEAQVIWQENGEAHWSAPFLKAYIYLILGDRVLVRQALDEYLPVVKPATREAGGYYYLWARLCLDEEELGKAEEYLQLALRVANQTGVPDLNVWVRLEYSRFHRLKGEVPVAKSWAEDATRFAQRATYKYLYGMALIERSLSTWECGDTCSPEADLLEAKKVLGALKNNYDLARASLLLSAFYQQSKHAEANKAWIEAAEMILREGYIFILERERKFAFPLVASHLRDRDVRSRTAAENLIQKLATVAPPPLKIYGLGQFIVFQGRHRIPDQAWKRRKSGELLRYLILKAGHSAGREEILESLWPESSPSTALDLFHQATSTLRHILEQDLPDKFPSRYLSVEGERVFLHLPPASVVDFEQFEQNLPIAIQSGKIDRLQQALSLYTDELFPMDRYADWSASRRETLKELYLNGLLSLGQLYYAKDQYSQALDCSRRILQLDSWSEDAVLLGMNACLSLKDTPRALRLYIDLERTLKEELNISPRSDLRALAAQLRQE